MTDEEKDLTLEIAKEDGTRLPDTIVGALPSPESVVRSHRVIVQEYFPDGYSAKCSCGWQSPLCNNSAAFENAWTEHISG